MGFFKAYEKSKEDPEVHSLVSYLVNRAAGTKLIFSSRLYRAPKSMDDHGQLTPQGSRELRVS